VGVNHDQNVKELREEAAMQRINVMMQQDGRMLNPAHLQYFVAA
jgi:hypothetical protein